VNEAEFDPVTQSLDCPFKRWLGHEGSLFRALHRFGLESPTHRSCRG
jgi:hypothetical protein